MIFLFKDKTFKVYDPFMEDYKLVKKFTKAKKKLAAVLVECSTSCHSDVYTIVKADHFKISFKPFRVTYTIDLFDSESPVDTTQSLTRTVDIETISDFYNITALMYQMNYTENAGDMLSLGDRRVIVSAMMIDYGRDKIVWDSKEDLIDFINRQDMICDTDEFLDAALPRDQMVENGEYATRYDRSSGLTTLQYYFHDRKYYLYLSNGEWDRILDKPSLMMKMGDNSEAINVYGMCINKTGLIYLASDQIAVAMDKVDSISIAMTIGTWYTSHNIWLSKDEISGTTYEGYHVSDVLYMGLYLPQIWDIERYLYDTSPITISCEFIINKRYACSGEYNVPHGAADRGLDLDLFAIFSTILSRPPVPISFDD